MDVRAEVVVFSDSLDVARCIELEQAADEAGIGCSFGVGTHLTNGALSFLPLHLEPALRRCPSPSRRPSSPDVSPPSKSLPRSLAPALSPSPRTLSPSLAITLSSLPHPESTLADPSPTSRADFRRVEHPVVQDEPGAGPVRTEGESSKAVRRAVFFLFLLAVGASLSWSSERS